MATKQHSTLTGSDLHINKIDGTTGTELTAPSETIYDSRWLRQTGGTITPTSNSTTTLKVTKQDGTTQVFDVDTTNGRVGIGTVSPNEAIEINVADPCIRLSNNAEQPKGFIGETFTSFQMGFANTSGSAVNAVPANTRRSFFGVSTNFVIGSVTNNFPAALAFRNVLDDGSGNMGVSVTSPNSRLQVAGPIATAITTAAKTGTYTVTATDSTVLGDTTSAAFTITLPTAVGCAGRVYVIKRVNGGSNNLSVSTTSSQTIDGATTKTLGAQFSTLIVQSDNAGWQILSTLGTVS